jgi:asparagine synthase (glutamine-hydrolysing)
MMAWVANFTDQQKVNICTPGLLKEFDHAAQTVFSGFYNQCDAAEDVHRLMYTDTKAWLADDLLMKVDKMSMARSLEARSPYLDHVLMEYVSSIPASMKLHGEVSKRILKQIAEEFLPKEIIYRRKHTFDVPIRKWLLGSLKDLTHDVIDQGIIPGRRWFDVKYLRGPLWQALEANEPGVATQFWNLVNLGLWARIYEVKAG